MSYVRSSTANPYGFRPWRSRLSGLGVVTPTGANVPPDMQPNVGGGDNATAGAAANPLAPWGTALTQVQQDAATIYQDLQTPVTLPVIGQQPLLLVLGALAAAAAILFGGGSRR